MEQRNKTLYVSKTMKQKRAEDFERITSPYGIQLRVNRSIQAERSFASVNRIWNSDDICTAEKKTSLHKVSFLQSHTISINYIIKYSLKKQDSICLG